MKSLLLTTAIFMMAIICNGQVTLKRTDQSSTKNINKKEISTDLLKKFAYEAYFDLDARKYDESIEKYERLIKLDQDGVYAEIAYTNIANAYQNKGNYEKAVETCQRGIIDNPNSFILWNHMGNILWRMDEYVRAKNAYMEALKLGAKNDNVKKEVANIYYNFAILEVYRNNISKAKEYFNLALALQPDFSTAYYMLARISFQQGNYKDAIINYEKVNPYEMNGLGLYQLAISYSKEDQIYKGISTAEKCFESLKTEQEKSDTLIAYTKFLIAGLYSESGNYKKASYYFHDILNNDALIDKEAVLAYLCRTHYEISSSDEAIDSLSIDCHRYPYFKDFYFSKALRLPEGVDERLYLYLDILNTEDTYQPAGFDYATVYNNIA